MDKGGILKHSAADTADKRLRWDEDNLLITEATRGGKMKVTEPKTPFVHYDAETDRVLAHTGPIPGLNIGDHPADLELELGTSLATVSDTDFGRPDSESTSDAESFSNDDDEPDPWTEEERAEEERLTEEEHAQKAEFEKHRKDFYRIDPNLLKRPLEDDEDDAENDEAESPDRNPKEAEMDEEKDAGDDFESMETDEPSPSLSGPAPVAPEAK